MYYGFDIILCVGIGIIYIGFMFCYIGVNNDMVKYYCM